MRGAKELCLCLLVGVAACYHLPAAPNAASARRHAPAHAVLSGPLPSLDGEDWDVPRARRPPARRVSEREQLGDAGAVSSSSGGKVSLTPLGDDEGFVFGEESLMKAVDALRDGSLVLLTEDGEDRTRGLLVGSPGLVGVEQLQFILEHAMRLQVALEPSSYRAVYRSLHKIVLDNNNLAHPALSVAARGGGRSPRNATHIASAISALLQTDWTAGADVDGVGDSGEFGGRDAAREIETSASSLVCPGAVSLGCCLKGGVLRRAGATEASVMLAKLAGRPPIGLHARLPNTSLDALRIFAARWGIPITSTADLVAYTRRSEMLVERCGPPARMPTKYGRFIAHTFRSRVDGVEHIALVKAREEGDGVEEGEEDQDDLRPFDHSDRPALVRVHSECCTGDIFGSLRCDCGPQLEKALQQIERDGWGCLLYLRGQEGRGIGLGAKMHAYALQERGVDTMDANIQLGLPVDSREYGTGAQILADLGIGDMRLMSNNPKKFSGLTGYGLRIVERVPSHTVPNPENIRYLRTKRERMGHMLGEELDEDEGAAEEPDTLTELG